MTDLDRLERLNRLREAGALSQEEFEQQKQLVLAEQETLARGPDFKPVIVGGVLFAAVIAVSAVAWDRRDSSTSASGAMELSTGQPTGGASKAVSGEAESATEDSLLRFAISDQVIGMNPAFVEKKLGVPSSKSANEQVYEIEGCTITYWSTANRINLAMADVTQSCRPYIRGKRIGPDTTFGQLMQAESWGKYVATCLTACGNAADPIIELAYPGSRSNSFITVRYWTDYDQASKALENWEKAVRRAKGLGEYDMPDDLEPFSCAQNPPAEVQKMLPHMRVRSVLITSDDVGEC